MNQTRIDLTAGEGEISHRERIHQVSRLRFLFRYIDLIIGGGIHHNGRIELRQAALHIGRARDIQAPALKPRNFVAAFGELGFEFHSQLATTPENRNAIRMHFFIMYDDGLTPAANRWKSACGLRGCRRRIRLHRERSAILRPG